MGEDQDAAGARSLHEAERGDGLAGAGRVLEPEAAGGAGVLGLLGKLVLLDVVGCRSTSLGSGQSSGLRLVVLVVLVLVVVLEARPRRRRRRPRPSSSSASSSSSSSYACEGAAPLPFWRSISAISAVSVPDSASTWCADRTVPSARRGSSSASRRSRPSISEYCWRHSTLGSSRPASISASAASNARRRAVPGRRAAGSGANGSRVNRSTRSSSSRVGMAAALPATSVVSAISRLVGILGRRHTHDGGATLVPGLQPARASLSAAAPRPAGSRGLADVMPTRLPVPPGHGTHSIKAAPKTEGAPVSPPRGLCCGNFAKGAGNRAVS